MDFLYSELKQKEVIGLNDGKHLGKVCDLSFSFPENNILGFYVTGCKGFKFTRQNEFIPIKNVVKIGEDAILVKFENKPDCPPPPKGRPPKSCPPPCPPPCPPQNAYDRRSYDEYE